MFRRRWYIRISLLPHIELLETSSRHNHHTFNTIALLCAAGMAFLFFFCCCALFSYIYKYTAVARVCFCIFYLGSKISTIEMLNKKKIIYHLSPHFVGIDDVSANVICVLHWKSAIKTPKTQRAAMTKQRKFTKSGACLPLEFRHFSTPCNCTQNVNTENENRDK